MFAPNTLLQNRYLIVRLIAKGGMGAVYEAKDQRLGSTVALKEALFNDPLLRKAFEREARLLANLRHPSLPKVTDHFTEGDGEFLVMEFIPGDDLEILIERNCKPFAVIDVVRWCDQLLDVLDYLHTQKRPVIHRDIKPYNLKLTERDRIVLLDFGLAKDASTHSAHSSHSSTGVSIRGFTLQYAPPEQIQGSGTDPRSDLFALAATAFHLLTCLRPPDAMTRALKVLDGQPDPLCMAHEMNPLVPSSFSALLFSAMALSRNNRPVSAAAMRTLLRDATRDIAFAPTKAKAAVDAEKPFQVADELPTIPFPNEKDLMPPSSFKKLHSRIITAHKDAVAGAVFSPDGNYALSGGLDGAVRLWDLESGREMRSFTGNTEAVTSVAFASNGRLVLSGGRDKTIRLWDAKTGEQLRCFTGHKMEVSSVSFSSDCRRIISGSHDKTVRLWDLESGLELRSFTSNAYAIYSVAFSHDDRRVLAGSWKTASLWDLENGLELRSFADHESGVLSVAFSPTGRFAMSCSWKNIYIWELQTGMKIRCLTGHKGIVESAGFSPEERRVVSGGRDNTVRIWYLESGKEVRCLTGHADRVSGVALSPDGCFALSCSDDKTIRLWRLQE